MSEDFDAMADRCYERGRQDAIEECAAVAQRWSDDAAEFKDTQSCVLQANLCRNLARAIRSLAVSRPTREAPHE